MLLNELNTSKLQIQRMIHVLKEHHGFEFPLHEPNTWPSLAEHHAGIINRIHTEQGFNTYHADASYVKSMLIQEAVRMLLEIQPRRMRKKHVKEHTQPEEILMTRLNEKAHKSKPDFLDVDGDGDTQESFKQAVKDKAKHKKKSTQVTETQHGHTFQITFVTDHSDEPETTTVNATDVNQARRKFLADNPDTYIEKITLVKESVTLHEDAQLDQAQTLLAAKDISDRLQDMAEDAAKMAVDRLMPLVDTMKSQFGQPAADGFNSVVKAELQKVLDTIIAAKDATDNAVLSLQHGETPSDATGMDLEADLPAQPQEPESDSDTSAEASQIDFEKQFAAAPAASGPKDEPLGRARKQDVAEAKAKNPYAIGMAQAQKITGDTPPLKKSTIRKAHKIADEIKKDIKLSEHTLHNLLQELKVAQQALREHMVEFKKSGAPDLLGLGRGWQGDLIAQQIKQLREQITEAQAHAKHHTQVLEAHDAMHASMSLKATQLQEQISHTPWGVLAETHAGQQVRKFFEHETARDMWLEYNQSQLASHELVSPERLRELHRNLQTQLQK